MLLNKWSSYHAEKQRVLTPKPCNSSIFSLLKALVHTWSSCINYTKAPNSQQETAVDCSDQPIYALSKISGTSVFSPVWCTSYWERVFDIKCKFSGRNRTWWNSRGFCYWQSVDVNHIHKGIQANIHMPQRSRQIM